MDSTEPSTEPRPAVRPRAIQTGTFPGFQLDQWYRVVSPPADVMTPPLPGYLWVELHGQPRHVWAAHFDIRTEQDGLMSGYGIPQLAALGIAAPCGILTKPVPSAVLLDEVRRCLRQRT